MQLDFGEEGEPKYYNVIDARPRQPARVEPRPYVGARPLRTVTVTQDEVIVVDVADHPHLRVVVDCSRGVVDPDINRRVREAIPGVVSVDLIRPRVSDPVASPERGGTIAPRELYARYLQQQGGEAADVLLAAFDALHDEALGSETAP